MLRDLYTQTGNRIHLEQRQADKALMTEVLEAAGLPASYADAWDDPAHDDAIRTSHEEGMALVGNDVGTPIIRADDTAFFGPIVSPSPKGEDAGRLWDYFRLLGTVPGFYEIKRSRYAPPDFT